MSTKTTGTAQDSAAERAMPEEEIVSRAAVVDWLNDNDIEVTDRQIAELFYAVPAQPAPAQAVVPADAAEPTCTACGATLHEVTQSPNSYLSAEQFDADKLGDWYCKCCPQGPSDGSRTHRYFWDRDLVAPALAAAPQPSSAPAPAQPGQEGQEGERNTLPFAHVTDENCTDPGLLWAEIHHLRAAVQGPEGYPSWQAAAAAERARRVKLETAALAAQRKVKP